MRATGNADRPETMRNAHDSESPPKRTVARTCMIVDDDPALRMTLAALLDELGLFEQILLAENGSEALKLAAGEDPSAESSIDMVLCDLHMPGGLDGIEFLRRFKGERRNEGIPVLMLTSDDGIATKVRALNLALVRSSMRATTVLRRGSSKDSSASVGRGR